MGGGARSLVCCRAINICSAYAAKGTNVSKTCAHSFGSAFGRARRVNVTLVATIIKAINLPRVFMCLCGACVCVFVRARAPM